MKIILISIEQEEDSRLNIEDGLVWIGFLTLHVSAISLSLLIRTSCLKPKHQPQPLYLYHSTPATHLLTFDHSDDLTQTRSIRIIQFNQQLS